MLRILKRIQISWPLVILGIFYTYLSFHALSGSQGLLKWSVYEREIGVLEANVTILVAQREALGLKIERLRAQHLDTDMLDVEARRILNVSHPNEIVIWLDETP